MNLIKAIELIRCVQINLQNTEAAFPMLKGYAIFQMSKMQLDEGLKLLNEE